MVDSTRCKLVCSEHFIFNVSVRCLGFQLELDQVPWTIVVNVVTGMDGWGLGPVVVDRY